MLLVLILVVVGGAFALDVQAGALVEGVGLNQMSSLDARVGVGPVTLQAAVGLAGIRIQDPTFEFDGEDEELEFTARFRVGMLQIGAYYPYWRPAPLMSVYSGLRYGFGFGRADITDNGDNEVSVAANAHKLKLIALGWDFSPMQMENLVFSVGVGAEHWWLSDIVAELGSEEITLDLGLSGWSTTVEFGARVRF